MYVLHAGADNFSDLIELLGKTGQLKGQMWPWLIHHSLVRLDLRVCRALVNNAVIDLVAMRCKVMIVWCAYWE